jgi:hypothetical protein
MSREARDDTWAVGVEAKLRAVVMARADNSKIRVLECRTSLCAMEVSSLGDYFGILRQEEQVASGVYDNGSFALGWESDPSSGAKVTITLRVFERRVQ